MGIKLLKNWFNNFSWSRLNIRWPETLSAFGAIFSAIAAYYSFQVSDRSVQLTIRQTEYQNYLQRPQLSVIGGAIIPIGINSENKKYEYLAEIRVKNTGGRSALDVGLSAYFPLDIFGVQVDFPRGSLDKDIEYSLHKKFDTEKQLQQQNDKTGYLAWAYNDISPKVEDSGTNVVQNERCAGVFVRELGLASAEQNKGIIVLGNNLPLPFSKKIVVSGLQRILDAAIRQGDSSGLCHNTLYPIANIGS